ncbi:ABC transporter permease [Actinomadura sp. 9N215]|uniref:ABC transporter permease n=1 Tax=Actinomadura sp. 9N215 TaxID=3375150 RepID=UPI0037B57553
MTSVDGLREQAAAAPPQASGRQARAPRSRWALRLIVRRLLILPLSLFILVTLSFGLIELIPGNPAVAIAGSGATHAEVQRISTQLGLDRPLAERYLDYLGDTVRGDLGTSYFSGQSVATELRHRMPATLELIVLGLALASGVGLGLGTLMAYRARGFSARLSNWLTSVLQSAPDFLLGLLLIYLVFFKLGWVPSPVGQLGLADESVAPKTGFMLVDTLLAGRADLFASHVQHLVLPVVTLGLVYGAFMARLTESLLSKALRAPQVEFARACGLRERDVLRYAVLDVRGALLTYVAILFGTLIGGASILDRLFSWQGAGAWALDGILKLDAPVIQGFILAAGALTILAYLACDVASTLLDPRVRDDR